MDSVIALEDLGTALISPGQEIVSLGYKVMPVFVFASVSAPAQERTDTLYYYLVSVRKPSKTDTESRWHIGKVPVFGPKRGVHLPDVLSGLDELGVFGQTLSS